jgi:hypothetical protein
VKCSIVDSFGAAYRKEMQGNRIWISLLTVSIELFSLKGPGVAD